MMTYAICGSCSTVVPAGYYHRCFVPTHAQREIDLLRAEVERMRAVVEAATTLHRRDEWHEDDGNVIWWTLPIEEPPYVGTLLDEAIPDYVTHWTRLVVPAIDALDAASRR